MIQQGEEETVLRKYLLGDLDENVHEEVEERMLCDEAFADRLSAAQNYLIDDYVFDSLSDSEREKFQRNFVVNQERREKIRVAETLQAYVSRKEAQQALGHNQPGRAESLWQAAVVFAQAHRLSVAFASIAVLIIVLLSPRIVSWLRPSGDLSSWETRRIYIERQLAELNRNRSISNNGAAIDLQLQETVLRAGGQTKRVVISSNIQFLNVQLEFQPQKYQSYQALVLAVERNESFAINDLKSEKGNDQILFSIPTEFLPDGDYQIDLKGTGEGGGPTDIARYSFRLIRSN